MVSSSAPILVLKDAVLFPGTTLPIFVASALGVEAINAALSGPEKSIIAVTIKASSQEKLEIDQTDLYQYGTKAVISRMNRVENSINVLLNGISRVKVDRYLKEKPYFEANITHLLLPEDTDPETEALHRETLKIFGELKRNSSAEAGLPISELIKNVQNPIYQSYLMAAILGLGIEKEQTLLEASTRKNACKVLYDFISYEQNVQKLREKISTQVANELGKEQREYVLHRHLDEIQKELGEKSGKEDLKVIEEQLAKAELPEKALNEAKKQLKRLSSMTPISPEYQVTHSYLEHLIELPWNKRTEDNLDLQRAETVLNEDHFDLKDVKERIIEQLAVLKLNPSAKAPILCFVGPPGVGKTSLGQSIARALGRKFERMSLGGMHDEAELRGHRRTYIGAMPGRIMEAIRRAAVSNPLIMLDEIDKLGADFRGDPAAALMEILDPAQNFEFHDNYLDVPFDLSKVLFITTANTTDNISKPLLDRMEILRLAGYTEYEKVEIAKRYLIPREISDTGILPSLLILKDEVLGLVIREYTREAGVRELQRSISHIARKIAIQVARGINTPVEVTQSNIQDFLGPKKVFLEQIRKKWGIGISTGMAWTETGGDLIYIETSLLPKRKDEIKITGHIGNIMRESVTCALSYVWAQAAFHSGDEGVRDAGLHVHIPAGAIPKDGPSAGVAIATALASLYTKKPVRNDLAMTGEITLSGLILPVGGIKEKVLAAHRAGIREIVMPRANIKDINEIPEQIRNEIKFFFADEINEVLHETIPGIFG
ncbi:MAG: endopeptidase La [Bdellovibrionales bacterium GWA2_49_15]|nr:MAG: endopeptidase La [Bdellovibrionales bacterium GWA2_49_15]HAZ14649.1 endopeptidase La [Bdellovibrionales bacterium]